MVSTGLALLADGFELRFRQWVTAVCDTWEYSSPSDAFFGRVRSNLSDETLAWVGLALQAKLIEETQGGLYFQLASNPTGKGPYKWFSKRSDATEPQCNWEYFVQVAWFSRLAGPCALAGFRMTFEDDLMDLAVWSETRRFWCIEVKRKADQCERLLRGLSYYMKSVPIGEPDRGNDALRKAKYLAKHRPNFLSVVADGYERHFSVEHGDHSSFLLSPTDPPVPPLCFSDPSRENNTVSAG